MAQLSHIPLLHLAAAAPPASRDCFLLYEQDSLDLGSISILLIYFIITIDSFIIGRSIDPSSVIFIIFPTYYYHDLLHTTTLPFAY
ncbi:hypothetical protein GGR51DRAFT_534497 [Nemania sp. FL0031]|nr:hypothetical protein GGR51DRAFT_534497 [Nemania sp. FL0031]